MHLKTGKEEIVYLLSKVIDLYEEKTGDHIVRNTNRKNYEKIARLLSGISGKLPYTSESLQHESYPVEDNEENVAYPFRKYDITSSQIKDASLGIVNNPRPFLVDACYIYLFGVGRKGFEANPLDAQLLVSPANKATDIDQNHDFEPPFQAHLQTQSSTALEQRSEKENDLSQPANRHRHKPDAIPWKSRKRYLFVIAILSISLLYSLYRLQKANLQWRTVQSDMSLIPYQPSQEEIDSLEGVWLSYTASPQARSSNPDRYHLVVCNVIDVRYKNGYFTFNRYGASFDHMGYMQYESPWIVSIHSFVRNSMDSIESPRHSLLRLDQEKRLIPVISASWNFDVGKKNNIIGNREVYVKQGRGGTTTEVLNTLENANCHCKIVQWKKKDGKTSTFYLRNELLDSLPNDTLRHLLDESSILPREPNTGLLIRKDSALQGEF